MILVTGHIRVPPQAVEALRPHIQALVEATRQEDGCILYAFAEDMNEPGVIRIVERWRDWPSLEAHGKAPHIATWSGEATSKAAEAVRMRKGRKGFACQKPTKSRGVMSGVTLRGRCSPRARRRST